MTTSTDGTVELAVDTIRTLSMDAVQKANSGHPGTPMALAPLAFTLYTRVMRHSPEHPDWFNRDRFVLSAGHASMLLYSTLYLSGYGLSLDDLKNFRQLGSPTAGHPEYEYREAPGIEATTGPLGQGLAMSVGMALAERMLAARFRRRADRPPHLRHRERRRPPGGRRLGGVLARRPPRPRQADRLLRQQPHPAGGLDGPRFSEDVGKRYEAYGWHVQDVGEDLSVETLERATEEAKAVGGPALADHRALAHRLRLAPQAGHLPGARLAARRGRGARHEGGLRLAARQDLLRAGRGAPALRGGRERGRQLVEDWEQRLSGFRDADPEAAAELELVMQAGCPTAGTPTRRASIPTTAASPRARRRSR